MDDDYFMFAHHQPSIMVIEDDDQDGFVMVGHAPDGLPLFAKLEPVKQHFMGFVPPEYLEAIREKQIAEAEMAVAEAEEAVAAKREARRVARARQRDAKAKAERVAVSKARRLARKEARQEPVLVDVPDVLTPAEHAAFDAHLRSNTDAVFVYGQSTAGIDPIKVSPPRAKSRAKKN